MKSFEGILGKDELVVTQSQTHWACLIPHILLIFIWIGFITIWKPLISFFTTSFVITNKRLYGKVGLINTKTLDTPLNRVNSVSVSSGLFGKIFGYGTIHITNFAGSYNFNYIKNPTVIRTAIMDEIEKYDDNRIKRQALEMANAINNAN